MHFSLLMFLLMQYRVSASTMSVELYKEGHRVNSDIISKLAVSSRIQCAHRCKRRSDCQGMNVEVSTKSAVQCELTSAVVNQNNEQKYIIKDPGWDFFKVIQMVQSVRYTIKVVSNGGSDTGSLDESYISINGKSSKVNAPGLVLLNFDYEKGFSLDSVRSLAYLNYQAVAAEANELLDKIGNGMITIVAVHDTVFDIAAASLPSTVSAAFAAIGATKFSGIGYRQPYCLITMKGHTVSWKKEILMAAGQSAICEVVI